MIDEQHFVPYAPTPLPPAATVLALAPHADDEVFGCGGALALHARAGVPVAVVIATDGAAREDSAADRLAESRAAAACLGIPAPTCWHLPDRGLEYGEDLVERILRAIDETGADLMYAPSPAEAHPDHRALALAAIEAVRRSAGNLRLALYEIGIPLIPTMLLDITAVHAAKREAMRCFASQLAYQRYDEQIDALNRYRSYTLPADVEVAEAFRVIDAATLVADPLAVHRPEYVRQRAEGIAIDGRTDMPLVSVIVRSMDRPMLADALASIALQTWPNIEVLVVAASGAHRPLESNCGRYPLRLIGDGQPLHRCRAANLGLQAARGAALIFLDDDDIFLPHHIAALTNSLRAHPGAVAAYAAIRCEDPKGAQVGYFGETYARDKLLVRNFMPIHAVLFRRTAVDHGATFDTALDYCEDWDFWIQISIHGDFVFLPEVGAIYRIGAGSGFGVNVPADVSRASALAIYHKWSPRWGDNILYRIGMLAQQGLIQEQAEHLLDIACVPGDSYTDRLRRAAAGYARCLEIEPLLQFERNATSAARAEISALLASRSWRITAPLRRALAALRALSGRATPPEQ